MDVVVRVALAWTAFAVFHSLTMTRLYEDRVMRWMGERRFRAYHRLVFTAVSCAAFGLLVLYLHTLPDSPFYRLAGAPSLLFRATQLGGAAILLCTPWDLGEFVGIRQWRRAGQEEIPEPGTHERLFTRGAYAIVRHPLYLGFSAIVAFQPVQTRISFVSAAMVVLYFYVGTYFEERRLVRTFGDEYRVYRRRVPRFLPVRRPR